MLVIGLGISNVITDEIIKIVRRDKGSGTFFVIFRK